MSIRGALAFSGLVFAASALRAQQDSSARPPDRPTAPSASSDSTARPPDRPTAPSAPSASSARPYSALSVHLSFTGDINLGTRTLEDGLPPDSGRSFLQAVDSLLTGDLVIGNFEGVLSDSGISEKCGPPPPPPDSTKPPPKKQPRPPLHPPVVTCYAFATPSYLAPRLVEVGFTHLNVANNHANDYGLEARLHTQAVFDSSGVRTYGPLDQFAVDTVIHCGLLPVDEIECHTVAVVGVLGFTTYPFANDLLDIARSRALVDSLRPLVDVLVVTFHGGNEGITAMHVGNGPERLGREPRGDLRRWSHAVIDAGADLVVGHGPHVLRGVEFYRGKPIFYSLGNFATYRGFNLEGVRAVSALLQVEVGADGSFRSARMWPLLQVPQVGPMPDSTSAAIWLLRRLTRLDFPRTGARFAADGSITPP